MPISGQLSADPILTYSTTAGRERKCQAQSLNLFEFPTALVPPPCKCEVMKQAQSGFKYLRSFRAGALAPDGGRGN